MDDLVERLRDWPYQGETMARLAAKEITALRARLAEVEKERADHHKVMSKRIAMQRKELRWMNAYTNAVLKGYNRILDTKNKAEARAERAEAALDAANEGLTAAYLAGAAHWKAIAVRAEKALNDLCIAYAACNGEDHPPYTAARDTLAAIREAKQ